MHAPIVTLTMNPALDVSTSVEHVVPEHKLRCAESRFDPGGGGVNVARTIRNLGGNALAVYPLGGPTGHAYRGFAEEAGVVGRVITIAGNTRESFTVSETSTGKQYRFVLQGPTLHEPEWRACVAAVADHLPEGGYLVASGSLPPGVPVELYATLARFCAARGVRTVVDAAGPPLEAALAEGVFLVKPSADELAALTGSSQELGPEEQLAAARAIVDDGRAEVVALTLGAAGAVLVHAAGVYRLPAPDIDVVSAVGAGDAFLGAFVLRLAEGRSIESAFRAAVAAGSATAMMPGTELCHSDDVARLEERLERERREV
ncbi:1-phosphofructokinase family hexose kinase [Agromyces sp. NPDC055520]